MSSFATSRHVTARKPHRCAMCFSGIPVGTRHLKLVGHWEGDFYSERAHTDCYDLWVALFDDHADPWEGMSYDLLELFTGLGKDEAQEELNAYRGTHPHAVCRIEFRLRNFLEGDTK